MTKKQAIRSLIISWDWVLAIIVIIIIWIFLPSNLTYLMVKDVYGVSINILSIVFSVFFAALAILITAGDNEFVNFLEKDGSYSRIIWTYEFTLILLAISLIFSIIFYVTSLSRAEHATDEYPTLVLLFFGFMFLYSLFAVFQSSLDIIRYAKCRSRFLMCTDKIDKNGK